MNSLSQKLPHALRILTGLVFTVFGLNGFFHFIPQPPAPEAAGAFLGGLAAAGYFFPFLKATEVAAGIALLSNRFVPLALAVLAPIVLNIFAFHLFLSPGDIGIAVVLVASLASLAYAYRGAFLPMLAVRVAPGTDDAVREERDLSSADHDAAPSPAE